MHSPLLPTKVVEDSHLEALQQPYFIGRQYTSDSDENAFDHYVWSKEEINDAKEILNKVTFNNKMIKDESLDKEWSEFYTKNNTAFFKDRNWVLQEFPQLLPSHNDFKILDIGCGVGNTSLPLVEKIDTAFSYHIYACDYSPIAIKHFTSTTTITAFVHDALNPFQMQDINVATLFFVMSAIKPECWSIVFKNVFNALQPGGCLVFRDYGYYDLSQLRFKPSQCISDGLYQRSDGTLTYFAKLEWIKQLLLNCGFELEQLILDKRVLVNRKTKVKMKRLWIHGCFKKPDNLK